jgi:hypothetical protein
VGSVNEMLICTNCGDDTACEGYQWCSYCMETNPNSPHMYLGQPGPAPSTAQADTSGSPTPQHRVQRFG